MERNIILQTGHTLQPIHIYRTEYLHLHLPMLDGISRQTALISMVLLQLMVEMQDVATDSNVLVEQQVVGAPEALRCERWQRCLVNPYEAHTPAKRARLDDKDLAESPPQTESQPG